MVRERRHKLYGIFLRLKGIAFHRFHIRAYLVVVLLVIQAGLLAYSATKHSPTMLEPGFLVAGISHWEFGRFDLFCVNPPLVRMVAALPVLTVGCETNWQRFRDSPGARSEFEIGSDFIAANGERSIWLFTLARWACIPFTLLGGLFCFLWARDLAGESAGLTALILWCFDPNILGHGQLITTDVPAASLGLGATWLFWRWLRRPTWRLGLLAGIVLGLTELTKFSWIILFGLWPVLWLFWSFGPARNPNWRNQLGQLILLLAVAVYLVNFGYGFDSTFSRLKDFAFVSTRMSGLAEPDPSGNRFAESWLGNLPVPVPKDYLLGIDRQLSDFDRINWRSYLGGQWRDGGWWYYYLYGLAVKLPHGTQVLLLVAIVAESILRWKAARARKPAAGSAQSQTAPPRYSTPDLIVLLVPAIALFCMVSARQEFNVNFRYVLPVFGFMFVFIAASVFQTLSSLDRRSMTREARRKSKLSNRL